MANIAMARDRLLQTVDPALTRRAQPLFTYRQPGGRERESGIICVARQGRRVMPEVSKLAEVGFLSRAALRPSDGWRFMGDGSGA